MVDYKRILITGATGKIGQELARFLADYGYKILAVYRNEEKIFRWRNISWLKGDVESVDDGFRAGLNSVQVIIHLAGKLGRNEKFIENAEQGKENKVYFF
jgi:nucleoside-diphosphate-sugar epimerase